MPQRRIPVIYDTDLGEDIDDLYALYLALFHPDLELAAVTTVHGDTQRKARLAAKVLRMAGHAHIPVGAGIGMSQARIDRGQTQPDPRETASFQTYVHEDDPECAKRYPDATDLILKVAGQSRQPVALVGEGALSNLAAAVQRATPEQRGNIRCIAFMGGETGRQMREYNVSCDPEAADAVLTSGLPVFMGTYDVTSQLVMTMEDVERAFGGRENPVYEALYDCTQMWTPHRRHKPGPVLYDLAPVFWVADPLCVRTRNAHIRVELEGAYTRGQTVRVPPFGEGPVKESVELDAKVLMREFLDMIKHGAAGVGKG